jgi:hypothetical protein
MHMTSKLLQTALIALGVLSIAAPAMAQPWHRHYRHYYPGYVYAPPPVVYAPPPPPPVYAGPSLNVVIPLRIR